MIYISVDNDEHSKLAMSIIEQCDLKNDDVIFISHYSLRNNFIPSSDFKKIEMSGHPLSDGYGYTRGGAYVRSIFHQHKLRNTFKFSSDDILIVITEYQLNNAILAKKMKLAGGQVVLFDEGIGFYFNNSLYHAFQGNRTDKFYLSIYNMIFRVMGIPARASKGQEGRMYVSIKDNLIDRVYSRLNLPINRQIPINGYRSMLNSAAGFGEPDSEVAIFFATNFDCYNLKAEEMQLAALAIEQMARNFSKVYIKVHPSDYIASNDVYTFYESLIYKYKNVILIGNELTAVEVIKQYRPKIVAGAMSTALFDAIPLGCQPVFLFHMLPAISEFGVYNHVLNNLNYKSIKALNDIQPDYECEVDVDNLMHRGELSNCFASEANQEQSSAQARQSS